MRLLLAGAGHAHLHLLRSLSAFRELGWDVAVVAPSAYHYYSGMGPGLLGGDYAPAETRIPVGEMTDAGGGTFLEDRLVAIEADTNRVHLASGKTIAYDLLSCNVGSRVDAEGLEVAKDVTRDSFFPVKPIENLYAAHQRLSKLGAEGGGSVVVVGGGPAAVEIAGNAAALLGRRSRENGVLPPPVYLCAGGEFLRHFPERLRRISLRALESRGVAIRRGYIRKVLSTGVECADGSIVDAQVVLLATGVRPPEWLEESGLALGDDGGILVNRYLQSVSHPNVFAGGDCLSFQPKPIRRVGVHAVRQKSVLLANLMAAAEAGGAADRELPRRFSPQSRFLLILNLGDGRGVAAKWGLVLDGTPAFRLKDRIDRRFVGSV
ncbi:MAG: NAD(P)/FAD-dependent oxidoreductase [Spirochaetaceae bacterium]